MNNSTSNTASTPSIPNTFDRAEYDRQVAITAKTLAIDIAAMFLKQRSLVDYHIPHDIVSEGKCEVIIGMFLNGWSLSCRRGPGQHGYEKGLWEIGVLDSRGDYTYETIVGECAPATLPEIREAIEQVAGLPPKEGSDRWLQLQCIYQPHEAGMRRYLAKKAAAK